MTNHFTLSTALRTCRAFTLKQRGHRGGFTLAEMLVSIAVLALLVLIVTQLINSAATIVRPANKHISTDTQARTVFDRMAPDFAQMLKRTDVDYYVKGPTNYNGHGNGHGYGHRVQTGQQGSDQIAFFSQVAGYDPTSGSPSPISVVGYRVNNSNTSASYLRLERMGKRLIWNDAPPNGNNQNRPVPIVFLPVSLSTMAPPAVDSSLTDTPSTYETIGPGVFRFEYYYLLKNGNLTDIPWDTTARPAQQTLTNPVNIGLVDVEAIAVAIAVIDSAGRALIDAANTGSLADLASDMADFRTAPGRGVGGQKNIGDLEYSWNTSLLNDISAGHTSNLPPGSLPPEAAKYIRIYSRTFDLRTF
jgi:prepilin-type N-terminal cleavage/methylation domain-containing protein